jgi:hypothetical protein
LVHRDKLFASLIRMRSKTHSRKQNSWKELEYIPSRMLQKFLEDCKEMPRLASQGSGFAVY